jgi:uncharacterized membrane protein
MLQDTSPKRRIEFIDLLRGWAVIVMIETHVFNATLLPPLWDSPVFQVIKFINGLVAPSFLFASGMAYAVTTRRKINDYLSFGWPLFRQIGRLLFVMVIGYSLHIPKFNYYHLRYEAGETAWQIFWQVDVLQCIAASLLFLQVMLLILRSERRLYAFTTGCALIILVATPVVWGIEFRAFLPVPLASFMNGVHESLFPLFPWSVFLFAGAIAGHAYLRAKDAAQEHPGGDPVGRTMNRAAFAGLALIVVSFPLHALSALVYPTYDYWLFSPAFTLLRLGIVLLLCAGMYRFEQSRGVSRGSMVTLVGRESLLVYATHLLLVYGKFGPFTFTDRVRHSFRYPEAVLTTLILLALMIALAYVWEKVKAGPLTVRRLVQTTVLACFILVFFFGPN